MIHYDATLYSIIKCYFYKFKASFFNLQKILWMYNTFQLYCAFHNNNNMIPLLIQWISGDIFGRLPEYCKTNNHLKLTNLKIHLEKQHHDYLLCFIWNIPTNITKSHWSTSLLEQKKSFLFLLFIQTSHLLTVMFQPFGIKNYFWIL